MIRLIDADKLRKNIDEIVFHIHDRAALREMVLEKIDEAPTVATIPEYLTNGGMIKALFPKEWWNAPYKGATNDKTN